MGDRTIEKRLTGTRVLVVGGEENPALPVVKSLAGSGADVSIASHARFAPGLYSRHVNRTLKSPDPWGDEGEFIQWALDACRAEKYDVIIPMGEKASYRVAKHQEKFRAHVHVPFPDFETYMICRDKALTMKAAERLGVPIPKTYYPDEEPIEEIGARVSYPVVVKPTISYGARGIYFPGDAGELVDFHQISTREHGPCIIQEYIPQTGMQYKVETLSDHTGAVKAAGVYDKPRFYPITGGSSTLNRTVHRPDICRSANDFARGVSWFGMADFDFIEDPRDGVAKLMEINPRFTRSIKILVEAGLDYPTMLVEAAMGKTVRPADSYKIGLHMRYLLPDCMWFVKSPTRFSCDPSFFKFWGRDVIYEMLSLDDVKPGASYLLTQLLKVSNTKGRRKLFKRAAG
ncbi:MAG: ATP-grasp domain-containing protein [Desulfobacterales bacterium]|nr:ATP-grasp domain-containing protein [Desulfobacterales bacterium]